MALEVPDKWRAQIVRRMEAGGRCGDGTLVKVEAVIAFQVQRKRPDGDSGAEDAIVSYLRHAIAGCPSPADLGLRSAELRGNLAGVVGPSNPYLRVHDVLVFSITPLFEPSGIRTVDEGEEHRVGIAWSLWKGAGAALVAGLALVAIHEPGALGLGGLSEAVGSGTWSTVFWVATALAGYAAAAFFLNETTVCVSPAGVRVDHGPLPWPSRGLSLDAGPVARVEVDRGGAKAVGAETRLVAPAMQGVVRYGLDFFFHDGSRQRMPRLLGADQADFVQWHLNDRLVRSGQAPEVMLARWLRDG